MGRTNWWRPKTHQLQWSASSHHSEGLHFCHFSTTFISTFNWCNSRRLHLPVGIGWYFPVLLTSSFSTSVWRAIPALLAFPFHAIYCWLLLVGGFVCNSNILNIFTLKEYTLRCIDMFRTPARLLGSFLYDSRKYFSFVSSCQIVTILIPDGWERARNWDMMQCSL